MDSNLKQILWHQFGASIDTLENAIHACPEELWGDMQASPDETWKFWYTAYHTLFWLDFYLSDSAEGFTPPSPFGMEEMDPAGVCPDRAYAKDELQTYLDHCREKCRIKIESLTDEKASRRLKSGNKNFSTVEWLLYNMRHVQHHAGQLNLILRRETGSAPGWVNRAKHNLNAE